MRYLFILSAVFLLGIALSGCRSVATSTRGEAEAGRYADFTYVAIDAVKQSDQASCGAAALACVLGYWGDDVDEAALWADSPPEQPTGYRLPELRDIALQRGFQAFALADVPEPEQFLEEQVALGRPVLIAVVLPEGRYFGAPVPIIETFDRRALKGPLSGGGEGDWKRHYVVVIGYDDGRFLVMDPAYGIVKTQRHELLMFWRAANFGTLLLSA